MVPPNIQRQAGIKAGGRLQFKVSGGINIIPDLPSAEDNGRPIGRNSPPERGSGAHPLVARAEGENTAARLRSARKGPHRGPFATAHGAIQFLRREIRARNANERKAT